MPDLSILWVGGADGQPATRLRAGRRRATRDARAWLAKHGAEYGLCQIYRNEAWHYELLPESIDDGCCPSIYADPS